MGELEAVSIQYLLDTEAAEAKKSPLRRLLIEPFLCILHRHDVVPSSRKLPLNRMTEALFGLGRTLIEPAALNLKLRRQNNRLITRRQLVNVPRSWR